METSILTPTHKCAAAALFALALHRSQIHQSRPSDHISPHGEASAGEDTSVSCNVSVSDDPDVWIHENYGLLSPVFRLLGLDDQRWEGLKEKAGISSETRNHIESFLELLSEKTDEKASEEVDKELALTKAVDATELGAKNSPASCENLGKKDKKKSVPEAPKEEKSPDGSRGRSSEHAMKEGSSISYQRKITVLYEILSACIADAVEENSKCKLREGYDSRYRVALRLLASWLDIKLIKLETLEIMVAYSLADSVKEDRESKGKSGSNDAWANRKHGGVIGAAAITGGTLMAITGGLAAPAIANGLGVLAPSIGVGGLGAAASAMGSVAGSVAVAASFGAAGAGLAGVKMAKRTGDINEFEFEKIGQNHNQGRLAVEISVSGLINEEADFKRPWEKDESMSERYVLRWESKNLIALSTAVRDWLESKIAMELMKEGAMMTVLSSLLYAFAMPAALLSAINLLDSKWAIAIDRSDKAGNLLAEVLLKGLHGNRPVTLIGFSLGARVIFECLRCLAESEGENAGIVERVVLLGAPVQIEDVNWEATRKIVSGRFINAYSTNDWILGIIFRASLFSQGLAGTQPVKVQGIQNVDVTEFISGHSCYITRSKEILDKLDLENYYPVFKATQPES